MLTQKTVQARQCGPHLFEPKGPRAPKWFIVDAKDQVLGRLASTLARVITGKHKRTYTRHADSGDFVVVLNAEQVRLTADKWRTKKYYDHSGYVGGLKTKSASELLQRHPTEILRRAVWGMTNKSSLARRQMGKLKLVVGDQNPHAAQKPQALPKSVLRAASLS